MNEGLKFPLCYLVSMLLNNFSLSCPQTFLMFEQQTRAQWLPAVKKSEEGGAVSPQPDEHSDSCPGSSSTSNKTEEGGLGGGFVKVGEVYKSSIHRKGCHISSTCKTAEGGLGIGFVKVGVLGGFFSASNLKAGLW